MTDDRFDTAGKIQFFHGMGLISEELYEIAKENCRGNYSDPSNASCAESIQAIDDCTKDINLSHILEPLCEVMWSPRVQQASARDGKSRLLLEYSSGDDLPFPFKCRSDTHQLSYIWANDETVRESLGVRKGTKGKWKRCDFDIPYTRDITSTVEHHLRLRREIAATTMVNFHSLAHKHGLDLLTSLSRMTGDRGMLMAKLQDSQEVTPVT